MKANNSPEAESFDAAELGAMMREMRENLSHELETVARDLRIRLVYLEAIEAGRLSDLPGNAYVSGFLRAYSDFLGLEGDEIVRRFKMAGAEISNQPQLHLPSPVEEGRLPTASILLVAAVIAAAAYGGWYYLSSAGKGPIETVASLPKELSGRVDEAKNQTVAKQITPSSETPSSAAQTSDTPAPESPEPAATTSEVTDTSPETSEPATASPEILAAQAPSSPVSTESVLETPAPEETASAVAASTPAVVDEPLEMPVPATVPAEPARTAAVSPTASVPAETSASAAQEASTGAADQTASQTDGSVRIVVRATADSYVAVRTGENEPLFSQLMRPGESYEVPLGADLVLETGNAGGLQITIGGKQVPSLGPIGQIRRNIPLDAEKLLRGLN